MEYIQHGNPAAQAWGPSMGQAGCGCTESHGPTPSPFPPSPIMPGPSMQQGGHGGPQGQSGQTGSPQGGMSPGPGGHTGCNSGSHASGAGSAGHAHPGAYQSSYMYHPPLHEAYRYGYYPHGAVPQATEPSAEGYSILGLDLSDGNFWKGALIGAALTLLVTNETVQRAIMMGVAKAYSAAEEGVGEIKEMFEDAQAELKKPSP